MPEEPCIHFDFDWINPYLDSDDDMDEVLACTECGYVQWTAREIHATPLGDVLNRR
jgi:hypothetical protein